MIRFYMKDQEQIQLIGSSNASSSLEMEFIGTLDVTELQAAIEELEVIVFDLASGDFKPSVVIDALGAFDDEQLPPVLYILKKPADIELLTEARGLVNQDYSFAPVDPAQLAARLETLKMLGARRRLTMETVITDRLTGLYNRKYFLRRLEEELYRAGRYGYKGGVLLATLDFEIPGGKLTEDTGTTVIKAAAEFLVDRLRKTDIVARYKWDSFAFLLPEIPLEDCILVAQDVRTKLELLPVSVDDSEVTIHVSLGHIQYPYEKLGSAVAVVEALEDCCFQAKTAGGTRIKSLSSDSTGEA
jgi:diguanylate cyclase (GGDEF)-like protein